MNEFFFSKKVQEYIKQEMYICVNDLSSKILKDVPQSKKFFNDLFEYIMNLDVSYEYDKNNLSNSKNRKFRSYLDNRIYEFFYLNGFTKESDEHFIFGQSWSLSEKQANQFAFTIYKHQKHYQNTLRVLLSTRIKKDAIFFYKKNGKENEVIVDNKKISKDKVNFIAEKI